MVAGLGSCILCRSGGVSYLIHNNFRRAVVSTGNSSHYSGCVYTSNAKSSAYMYIAGLRILVKFMVLVDFRS